MIDSPSFSLRVKPTFTDLSASLLCRETARDSANNALPTFQTRYFLSLQGNPTAAPGAADMTAWPSATALQPTGYYAGYDHPSLAAYG